MSTQPTLERLRAVCERTGLSSAAVYKLVRKSQFPRWIRIGQNSFWDAREVTAWIEARLAEGRQTQADTAKFSQLGRRAAEAKRRKREERLNV